MLINAMDLDEPYMFQQWYMWGGDWAEDLSVEELEPFYEAFSKLPIALEIETSFAGRVVLVHAELPNECDWLEIKGMLKNTSSQYVERERVLSDMLWRKSQPHAPLSEQVEIQDVANITHVFHGHTPVEEILNIKNRTFMDLGSYKTGKIGFLEVKEYLKVIGVKGG